MKISAIVACAKNNIIGKDGQMLWRLPSEFAYFRRITLNHCVIMGRKCYESIGQPLSKRTNIIITRNPLFVASGCLVANSINEALKIAKENSETEAFIILLLSKYMKERFCGYKR